MSLAPASATASVAFDETRGAVEYAESGHGETVVFVPGSFSTGSSWRGIAGPLAERYRTVTTSLCGYGKTAERRTGCAGNRQPHIDDELDVLESVLQRAGGPVHLVAHSFGAWLALALAMHRAPRLRSLTLLEPTVFFLLDHCGESALGDQVRHMTQRYMADWHSGERQAVRHVMDFYGGAGTFDAYPPALQDKLISQTPTNILDWQTAYAESTGLTRLAALQVPTLIVCGGNSHQAMQRCNQLLAGYIPQAQFKLLAGANHFMIVSHPAELTSLLGQHLNPSGLTGQSP